MQKSQLDYLNNLKIFLIILVVLQHSAEAYTLGEGWFVINPERVNFLKPMLAINSAFFMGLFFFISAYFVPNSLARYPTAVFLSNKIKRLLIPALIGVLLVRPLAYYVQDYPEHFIHFFITYFASGNFAFGHMWFLVQLFVYMLLFALLYRINPQIASKESSKPLTSLQVMSFIFFLFITTYLVAQLSTINQWYWRHLVEPYHLPQYISLFLLGTIAYRRDWLTTMSYRFGILWLGVALLCMAYPIIVLIQHINQTILEYTLWTAIQCVSLCIGLLVLFREHLNYSNTGLQFLSDNAFAVYIFHIPIVVWMQYGLLSWNVNPFNKFVITATVSYVGAYGISYLLRQSRIISRFI